MCTEQTSWLSLYKNILCSMVKTHYLFLYTELQLLCCNAYTQMCHETMRKLFTKDQKVRQSIHIMYHHFYTDICFNSSGWHSHIQVTPTLQSLYLHGGPVRIANTSSSVYAEAFHQYSFISCDSYRLCNVVCTSQSGTICNSLILPTVVL